ncbi:MAG TPA: DegT/DnrJ/EryC1/StrS family aminotransferase [Candidatus Hydrogenedentes bacterium]|nr:DegT/DnrJ/EryC1/StrS family aminotransferase [Candidatus Hydrogenedentota bacterium]
MPVPMLDLKAQYASIKGEIDAAVAEVLASQQFRGGPKVEALEQAIARYVGAPHAIGVASGTDALLLPLKAVGLRPGDEVITTPFTFFATAGAIVNAGGTPVFVDIDPDTYNINPHLIASRITDRTRAIIPVHLYGQCADMDPILDIAARRDLHVIEDAAQAIGARYLGRPACSMGHAAAISFYPTKNLGAAGEGGMVAARDDSIAAMVRLLRAHGAGTTYIHTLVGMNSHLHSIQAAVLGVKLRYLDTWNAKRRENAAYYNSRFAAMPEIVVPKTLPGNDHVFHQYVIRLPRRDAARALFQERGIGCGVFYPLPLHRQECFAPFGCGGAECPEADCAAQEVLALPIYPELTTEQMDEVVQAIKEHLARR